MGIPFSSHSRRPGAGRSPIRPPIVDRSSPGVQLRHEPLPPRVSTLEAALLSRAVAPLVFAMLPLAASLARSQDAPGAPAEVGTVATSYSDRFRQVMTLAPAPAGVADVENLVIQRDVARFTLSSGKLYLLMPVGGRTVGAVFRGSGTFGFAPTSPIEQARLSRYEKQGAVEARITDLVLLFADTTVAELRRRLTFHREGAPGEAAGHVREALKYLGDEDSQTFDPDLMAALLNGDTTDLFYAHIRRPGGDPLMFTLNPHQVEAVSLSGKATRWWAEDREVLSQFPRAGSSRPAGVTGERTDAAEIRRYVMQIHLPQSGVGEIAFAASARLDIAATQPVGPWVAFELFDKLKVDSARWSTGEPATVFKGNDSGLLWVRLDQRLQPGDLRTLEIAYRGSSTSTPPRSPNSTARPSPACCI